MHDIRRAQRSVAIDMYIFQDGAVGQRFQRALCQAAQRGIAVTVVYDRIGSLETASAFWERLRQAGVRVFRFRPWPWQISDWHLPRAHWLQRLLLIWRGLRIGFLRRDHRKLILIDERIGYTGGFNLMDECSQRVSGAGRWLDVMLRTEIPIVVQDLYSLFYDTLRRLNEPGAESRAERKRVREAIVYPRHRFPAAVPVQRISAIGGGLPRNRWPRLRRQLARLRLERGRLHVVRALKRLIARSRTRVYLMFPYFVPYGGILRMLGRQAERGVDVQVFLSLESDLPWINVVSHFLAARLKKKGVVVRLYHGKNRTTDPVRFNHAKLCWIDDWVGIGSANLDRRSLVLNLETMVLRWRPQLLRDVERFFQRLSRESTDAGPLLREDWRGRLLYLFRRFL